MTLSPIPIEPRARFSAKARAEVFERAGGICALCGGKISVGQAWEIEHETPLAMGGTNDPDNLRPVHAKCHKAKTATDVDQLAKAKRRAAKHFGTAPRKPLSRWKKKLNGQVVERNQ